jgi:hypothetical protein
VVVDTGGERLGPADVLLKRASNTLAHHLQHGRAFLPGPDRGRPGCRDRLPGRARRWGSGQSDPGGLRTPAAPPSPVGSRPGRRRCCSGALRSTLRCSRTRSAGSGVSRRRSGRSGTCAEVARCGTEGALTAQACHWAHPPGSC